MREMIRKQTEEKLRLSGGMRDMIPKLKVLKYGQKQGHLPGPVISKDLESQVAIFNYTLTFNELYQERFCVNLEICVLIANAENCLCVILLLNSLQIKLIK